MRKILLASAFALGLAAPASADVILLNQLTGTGDNVIFDSFNGTNLAVGSFNGQHTGFVNFTDLSGNPAFTGSASGNDIKIANTSDLQIQVFNTALQMIGTLTDVFSLKGTGNVTAFVSAVDQFGNPETVQVFGLGTIDPNAQSGFTLEAINGEVITQLTLVDGVGAISDFEHYRIDATNLPVPGPIAGAGIPGLIAAVLGLAGLARRRRRV